MKHCEIRRLFLPAAGLIGFAGIATAQADLYTINGVSTEDKAGTDVASAGLFSGDANPDIIVGAPENFIIFTANEGKATVHNGPTGAVLDTFDGDDIFDEFGAAVGGGFDFNNDGRDDVIVGAPFDNNTANSAGMARVFSGMTGGVLFQVDGDAMGDELGRAVSGAGDVNNDGFDDIIVGSLNNDAGGADAGLARVYSGASQAVLWTLQGAGQQRSLRCIGVRDGRPERRHDGRVRGRLLLRRSPHLQRRHGRRDALLPEHGQRGPLRHRDRERR